MVTVSGTRIIRGVTWLSSWRGNRWGARCEGKKGQVLRGLARDDAHRPPIFPCGRRRLSNTFVSARPMGSGCLRVSGRARFESNVASARQYSQSPTGFRSTGRINPLTPARRPPTAPCARSSATRSRAVPATSTPAPRSARATPSRSNSRKSNDETKGAHTPSLNCAVAERG